MRKSIVLMLVLVSIITVLTACGNKQKQYSGVYHTEANGHKRGVELDVTMTGDKIDAIIIDDMDSEYSITDPDNFQRMWPAKVTIIIQELQNMGKEGIEAIEVEVDDQGIPTSIENFNVDIIPDGCTDCAGMLILAVQDAFAN